jgi:hypothetical protein
MRKTMHMNSRRSLLLLLLGPLSLVVSACQQQSTSPSEPLQAPPFKPTASIQEIMASMVDPSADAIWDSVGTTVSAKGSEDRQPRTKEEWQQLRRNAITLIESTNLLMMQGRRVVAVGGKLADDGLEGVFSLTEAQRRLDSQHPVFVQFAGALHDDGEKMLKAIDEKNVSAMVEVGTSMDEICESCHTTFWYAKPAAAP